MKTSRIVLSTFAAFVVSVLAGVIHGFVLAADYAPLRQPALIDGQRTWQVILLPVAHFAFICGLMWVYTHSRLRGSAAHARTHARRPRVDDGTGPPWLIRACRATVAGLARRKAVGARARIVNRDRAHNRLIARQQRSAPT